MIQKPDPRLCCPPPVQELERRWTIVRPKMREAGIDALLIQGAHGVSGGGAYFRWFTGAQCPGMHPTIAIFPCDDLMTVIQHGNLGGETVLDGHHPGNPGVGALRTTASFPPVHYTKAFEAEIAAPAIRSAGYRTIGLVAAQAMYFGFLSELQQRLPRVRFVDATEMVDQVKAIKSASDIAGIRRTAAMQDEILERVRRHIRPGMRDFEVSAYGQYVGQLLGSEQGSIYVASAPASQPTWHRQRPFQNRQIDQNDAIVFQCENGGPDGYYVHTARTFTFGKPTQGLVDAHAAAIAAQTFTIDMLKLGTPCAEVFRAYNDYCERRGYPGERRLHCHGQGYESVERPLIRDDETMTIAADMNIGCHPGLDAGTGFATICDNFIIHATGAERLSRTPQTILEID
jgi:Xaa-Pro aminopeptidase